MRYGTCWNPRCGETIDTYDPAEVSITGLCPSCRMAGRWGAFAAFLTLGIVKLVTLLW
jgi:hypothetical protein